MSACVGMLSVIKLSGMYWSSARSFVKADSTLCPSKQSAWQVLKEASFVYLCRSALHLAARAGALDVLEVLLEDLEKADRLEYVNAADKSGITPVFLAKQRGTLLPLLFPPPYHLETIS